jgi:hypothetical protein
MSSRGSPDVRADGEAAAPDRSEDAIATDAGDWEATDLDRDDLAARVELLAEENRRLRDAYRAATRTRYRRTALGLLATGLLALGGGALFPGVRTILVALGGTGVFAAVLTYFLTPERFVAASVGETTFDALATNEAAVAAELGLADVRAYVPTDGGVRLFVPQFEEYALPDDDALGATFVVADDEAGRGLALEPTGGGLYEAFDRARSGPPPESSVAAVRQLADAAIEQFELLDVADVDSGGEKRVVVGVSGPAYRPLSAFDHPVPSLFAVGLARALDVPVTVAVEASDDDRYEALIACSWTARADAESGAAQT